MLVVTIYHKHKVKIVYILTFMKAKKIAFGLNLRLGITLAMWLGFMSGLGLKSDFMKRNERNRLGLAIIMTLWLW